MTDVCHVFIMTDVCCVFIMTDVSCFQDYGIWERGDKTNHGLPELNSSSIGMAKVGCNYSLCLVLVRDVIHHGGGTRELGIFICARNISIFIVFGEVSTYSAKRNVDW